MFGERLQAGEKVHFKGLAANFGASLPKVLVYLACRPTRAVQGVAPKRVFYTASQLPHRAIFIWGAATSTDNSKWLRLHPDLQVNNKQGTFFLPYS